MFDRIKGWITERSQANIYEVRATKMFNEFRKALNRITANLGYLIHIKKKKRIREKKPVAKKPGSRKKLHCR